MYWLSPPACAPTAIPICWHSTSPRGPETLDTRLNASPLRGKDLRFCNGCMACLKAPRCVIQDDANDIVEKMGTADVICFATPVYYYEMSGQMKVLLDRANPLFSADYRFRDIYLLTASAESEDSASDGPVNGLGGWIACFEKARLAGVVRGGGANAPGEMQSEKLTEAYEMGRNI